MAKGGEIVRAFTADHVVTLTGLSHAQLRTWDRIGFFCPDYGYEKRRSPNSRIYSFRDVVGLRTISVLLKNFRISLRELKKVAENLAKKGFEHWADTKLYVVNRQVHFVRPDNGKVEGVWDGQFAMLPIIDVIDDVENRVAKINRRSDEKYGKIERHRYVVRNSPVIAGTRIPTAAVRRFKQAGYTIDEIIKEYPTLTKKDVEAALAYEERAA